MEAAPRAVDVEARRWRQLVTIARGATVALATAALFVVMMVGPVALAGEASDPALLLVYSPPAVVTAVSLVAVFVDRRRRWLYGWVLGGAALFWVGIWVLVLVAAAQTY